MAVTGAAQVSRSQIATLSGEAAGGKKVPSDWSGAGVEKQAMTPVKTASNTETPPLPAEQAGSPVGPLSQLRNLVNLGPGRNLFNLDLDHLTEPQLKQALDLTKDVLETHNGTFTRREIAAISGQVELALVNKEPSLWLEHFNNGIQAFKDGAALDKENAALWQGLIKRAHEKVKIPL